MTDPSPANTSHIAKWSWLPLGVILVVAAGLRVWQIGGSSFWLDEFCSVECSTGRGLAHVALPVNVALGVLPRLTTLAGAKPWWAIWGSLGLDNHPPLYFILLRWWRDLFGESDVAARSLSVIPSLAGIFFLYDAVRVGSGRRVPALWASLLMCVAMPQIHFGQEARGYSLLVALVTGAGAAMARCERMGFSARRGITLGGAVLGMMLTHYFAIAAVAGLGVYAIVWLRGAERRGCVGAILIAGVVYGVAWGPFTWEQRHSVMANNAWQVEHQGGHVAATLGRAAVLPLRLLSEPAGEIRWAVWAAAAYVPPLFWLRRRSGLVLGYLLFVMPVLLVAGVDLWRDTELMGSIRYTVMAGPGLYLLIAAAQFGRAAWVRHLPAAIAVAICVATLPRAYSGERDWELLANGLQSQMKPGDALLLASAGRDDWYAGALYLGIWHYAPPTAGPVVLLTRPATGEVMRSLHQPATVWLVAGSPDAKPGDWAPGTRVVESVVFPDIGVLWELKLDQ